MGIVSLLKQAEKGELEYCRTCPWSPEPDRSIGFGVSCTVHGLNWEFASKTNSMIVVQDPGDTTPHQTGRLCTIHNAENPTDKTAQQNLHLWKAAVSLNWDDAEAGGFLRKHYWTNAIMHGASASTGLRDKGTIALARKCCSNVLADQIAALSPNVIVASGTEAVNSLYDLRVITRNWVGINHSFSKGPYHETVQSWRGMPPFKVYCTYHTSARVVNQTLSRYYESAATEAWIDKKTEALGARQSIDAFLSNYGNPAINARDKGMRFLLNHWLDIGIAIRTASKLG